MEDWAEIRRLYRAWGVAIKEIARRLGVARNTVRAALVSDEPPKYRRASRGSLVDAVEPRVRGLLAEFPRMPATVIAERIGWEHSIRVSPVVWWQFLQVSARVCPLTWCNGKCPWWPGAAIADDPTNHYETRYPR